MAAPLATLALAGALLHTLNHAAFKGLLFLGAGSVLARTHERNMEELGGLARRMPWTAWLFLLGAAAISALPPLNGFVSEWMTFQALLLGGVRLGGASGLAAAFAASMLALTGGLAAACFVKAFGVTFLGRPRSAHAEHATESPAPMLVGMGLLGAACILLGLFPGYALRLLDRPAVDLVGGLSPSQVVTVKGPLVLSSGAAEIGSAAASISVTSSAILLIALAGMAALVIAWPRARGAETRPDLDLWLLAPEPLRLHRHRVRQAAPPRVRRAVPAAARRRARSRLHSLLRGRPALRGRGRRPGGDDGLRPHPALDRPPARGRCAPGRPAASTATSATCCWRCSPLSSCTGGSSVVGA